MPEREQTVLAINSGSSSLKFGLYTARGEDTTAQFSGTIESHGEKHIVEFGTRKQAIEAKSPLQALCLLDAMQALPAPTVVGHRIVHGGTTLRQHVRVDRRVRQELEAACSLIPLHGPPALALLTQATETFPDAVQVACLDTVFHRDLPDIARVLPLPQAMRRAGVERMGFHGLSCESVVRHLGQECPARTVIAHLGGGCSVTALRDRRSVDTSMGFTPLGGVMMPTRSGDMDPGVIFHLLRENGGDIAKLEQTFYRDAGIAGVSESRADVHDVMALASSDAAAHLAITQFIRLIAKSVAAMVVSLGGLDLLVFTGGLGENEERLRLGVLAELSSFAFISTIRVVPARENDCIAQHAWRLAQS